MGHQYAGADTFPTDATIPDDPDEDKSATFNVEEEAAMDRTTYLHNRVMSAPAVNWNIPVDPTAASDNCRWIKFKYSGQWWTCGGSNTDRINYSSDYGATWNHFSLALASLPCFDLQGDPLGNVVITNDGSQTVYDYTKSTGAFASHAAQLNGTPFRPRVAYDEVHAVWVIGYCDNAGATGISFAYSTDRASWTDRTTDLQTAVSAFAGISGVNAQIGCGNGSTVVASITDLAAKHIHIASDNFGDGDFDSWTDFSLVVTTITALAGISAPIYSALDASWLISVWGTAAAGTTFITEIWRSTDNGVSWSHVSSLSTLAGFRIQELANIGRLWTGLTLGGQIVYSLNAGFHATPTWYAAGFWAASLAPTKQTIRSGGGGFMVLDWGGTPSSRARTSWRVGNIEAETL